MKNFGLVLLGIIIGVGGYSLYGYAMAKDISSDLQAQMAAYCAKLYDQ